MVALGKRFVKCNFYEKGEVLRNSGRYGSSLVLNISLFYEFGSLTFESVFFTKYTVQVYK